MKIRKKEQSVGILGKILNLKNNSKTDTYSANYLNDRLVKVSPTEPETGEEVWIQKGKNLFNITSAFVDCTLVVSTGEMANQSNRTTSDYISVSPNTVYTLSENGVLTQYNVVEYDENKNRITNGIYDTFTTGSTTKYIRFFAGSSNIVNTQLEVGNTVTDYEPYIEKKIFIKNEDGRYNEFINKKDMGKIIVNDIKCKNLLNSLNDISNSLYRFTYTNVDGKLTFTCIETGTGGTFPLYYEIECEPNTDYCFSWNTLSFAEGNKLFPYVYGNALDSSSEEHLLAYEDEVAVGRRKLVFNSGSYKKIVIGFYTTGSYTKGDIMVANDLQLEKGTVASNYVKHKEFSNMQIYSTSEQRIGTWVNGKPLYRKVLFLSQPTLNDVILHGIANIGEITNLTGSVNAGGEYKPITSAYIDNDNVYGRFSFSIYRFTAENLLIVAGSYFTENIANVKVRIIVEYTKTTD